jgi:3-isopropylmalate dehydrogenase
MTAFTVAVLPGDGIGPEVTAEAIRVLRAVGDLFGFELNLREYPVGAVAVAQSGDALPPGTRDGVMDADAVLLGAVGAPGLVNATGAGSPEAGLLRLRALLGVYANLRPVSIHPALRGLSPLRPERLDNVDLIIVRELTGGLYYGEPRGKNQLAACNTLRYTVVEVERIARVAFETARVRRSSVTSVDKANVLETSQLWRETVSQVALDFPEVQLRHLYVDHAAMRLVTDPASFDVLLTENMFGDILSDEAAVLAGSLGLLPSASLGDGPGLFEPVHGSAPDIAGRNIANPIGAIASAALLVRHGLDMPEAADVVDHAIAGALDADLRTADLALPGEPSVSTSEMGEAVARLIGEEVDPREVSTRKVMAPAPS